MSKENIIEEFNRDPNKWRVFRKGLHKFGITNEETVDTIQGYVDIMRRDALSRQEKELKAEFKRVVEGKKRKTILEKPRLFQDPSTLNELGGYSSVPFYCSLCFMGEMDIQDNKLESGDYACHCSIWSSSCGGKWLKWYDKKEAEKFSIEYPCEDNFHNQTLTDILEDI